MPSASTLLTFALAGIVLVVIPGPSVLFIVGRALAHGRRAALTSVAGNTTGAALVVVLVAFGLGAVAAGSAVVFGVLKLVGAAYLVYLGVQTIRRRGDLAAALGVAAGPAEGRLYRQGVVGVTNPKVLVFFADCGAVGPGQDALVGPEADRPDRDTGPASDGEECHANRAGPSSRAKVEAAATLGPWRPSGR